MTKSTTKKKKRKKKENSALLKLLKKKKKERNGSLVGRKWLFNILYSQIHQYNSFHDFHSLEIEGNIEGISFKGLLISGNPENPVFTYV